MDRMSITKNITWEGRNIRLSYTPRWSDCIDHVEIQSEDRAPLPITETGYKSHFFAPVEPQLTMGDIQQMVCDWLDASAKKPAWRDYLKRCEADKQLSMF